MEGRIGSYREVDTLGKSQLDLILQVYDGAITAYRAAREHYARNEASAGNEKLEKAKKFVVHLYTTLDPEKGGEIAVNLSKLYAFVMSHSDLVAATKDTVQIDRILNVLGNLRDGWAGLREQEGATPKTPATAGTQTASSRFSTTG
jgi:flagellar protein FliS